MMGVQMEISIEAKNSNAELWGIRKMLILIEECRTDCMGCISAVN